MKKILFLITIFYGTVSSSQNTLDNDSTTYLQEINATYKATQNSPINYQNIKLIDLRAKSIGQEPSLLLSNTPSITAYADGGHNQGYSYFRLRGMDQTRINITIDGVPLNDPTDQAFYFSNFVDILNSVSQIQIQRGLGITKNGTASYAGSIELSSPTIGNTPQTNIGLGYGSFNSFRSFASHNTGVNNNKGLYVRVSNIWSNGYKEHASNDSESLFLSGGLFLNKSIWKFNLLAGNQRNGLAWMAVPEEIINCDRTSNSNSKYEKDDFSQGILQIQNIYTPSSNKTIRSSIYYTIADGWWDFDLNNYYGLQPNIQNISRNSINSHLIGFFSNYMWSWENFKLTTGIHLNTYYNKFTESHLFSGDIWNEVYRYKDELSSFQKIEYKLKNTLFFIDIQLRRPIFNYEGNIPFEEIKWGFLNPKFGSSWQISDERTMYFNIGRSGREPAKYDMFQGNDILLYLCDYDDSGNPILPDLGNELIASVKAEYVTDFELGFREKFKNGHINLNYYYLNFDNERILNGNYGPNGLALTSSVKKSIRTGLELFGEIHLNPHIKLVNNSSYNYSKIKQEINQEDIEFTPILTPKIIINQECIYSINNLSISLSLRYQSESYMNFANTEALDDYILLGGRFDYQIKKYVASIFINNITDNYYFNSGTINSDGTKSYFVQAPRNIYVSLKKEF